MSRYKWENSVYNFASYFVSFMFYISTELVGSFYAYEWHHYFVNQPRGQQLWDILLLSFYFLDTLNYEITMKCECPDPGTI